MAITIAIHSRTESYSDKWIQYCIDNKIHYKLVNCYDTDIIRQLHDVDGLLWHWLHINFRASIMAKQLMISLSNTGITTFPDHRTCWHYDDKLGQKYLLESIGNSLVPSYVFFEKEKALEWLKNTELPKVFKLRTGAGSQSVILVKTDREAFRLCKTCFRQGHTSVASYFSDGITKIRKTRSLEHLAIKVLRMPSVMLENRKRRKLFQRQVGYMYLQDFLPNNNYDTRITVIGDRAFGFTRTNRPGDFRASGSGNINYNMNLVNERCVKIAFETSKKLRTQSCAYDFLFDKNKKPKISEISYCYQSGAVYKCPGYWDSRMNWHNGNIWPEHAIIEDVIRKIRTEKHK